MSPQDTTHIHLLLNHVPTIGTVVGLGLFVMSFVRRSEHLKHVSLEVLYLIALATLPAYISGLAAQATILDRPDVSAEAIMAHHDAALVSFIFIEITGFVAWLGLWQYRRIERMSGWITPAIFVLGLVTFAMVSGAATIGGEIRHPEIKLEESAIAPGGMLPAKAVADFVTTNPWVWPAAEALHFLGLSLLFGVLFTVNLRLMGGLRSVPFAALHKLLPWAMLGFGVNLVTGMLFTIAAADQYISNPPFMWKIAFMMVAGANLLYLTVYDRLWELKAGQDPVLIDRAVAMSAVAVWIGVIYAGRMLPFLGNAF
jgi:uncharacterized membrane protein